MKKLTFSFGVYLYEPILIVLQFRNASMHCKAGEISFLLASERIKYISYQYRSHQYSEGEKYNNEFDNKLWELISFIFSLWYKKGKM